MCLSVDLFVLSYLGVTNFGNCRLIFFTKLECLGCIFKLFFCTFFFSSVLLGGNSQMHMFVFLDVAS